MINEKELREMREPVRYKDGQSIDFKTVETALKNKADENGILMAFADEKIKYGSFISKDCEDCLVVYHPEHQKDYFKIAVRIKHQGNYAFITVNDFGKSTLLGNEGSKEFLKEKLKHGRGEEKVGALIGAGIRRIAKGGTNRSKLQEEQQWYAIVADIFEELDL